MAKHRKLICSRCGKEKPLYEFYVRRKSPKLYRKTCKSCERKRVKEYKKTVDMALFREKNREYRLGDGRFVIAISASKSAAKVGGYAPCSATPAYIESVFTGRCFACNREEGRDTKRLHMDHDHHSGDFRGWLCDQCNLALGHVGDSVDRLKALVVYMERSNG